MNPGDWRKHNHVQIAKYLFAQTEKVKDTYEHDHATERKFIKFPKKLENHLKKDHKKDPDVVGSHSHEYKHKSDKTWANLAVRIDMHPLAAERFDDAQTIYFVIEGCLKSDAILSFIRKHDLKASVLSVPSVTMWDAPELPMLIEKYLRGRRIIIVPDADWAKNPLVSSEARFLRRVLIEHGVRQVYVGSVPVKVWEQDNSIKGIDDWLAVGGDLADLQIVHTTG